MIEAGTDSIGRSAMKHVARILIVSGCLLLPLSILAGTNWLPAFLGTVQYDALTGDVTQSPGVQPASTCAATSHEVAYWKFLIQPSLGPVSSATLQLNEDRVSVAEPRPPVVHELWWYRADMEATSADYSGGTLIATFETDLNDPPAAFRFDVTKIVRANKRRPLGFRVNTRTPYCEGENGTRFGDQLSGAWIEVQP
jgi:hypothetical protein